VSVIGVVVHQHRPVAVNLARTTIDWAEAAGSEVRMPLDDAELVGRPDLGRDDGALAATIDLAVSLGGDGTMLRTVRLVAAHDVDVLGVNVGQLGYLTEVEPGGLEGALERYAAGDFAIESRLLLSVRAERAGAGADEYLALNEAVLEKTSAGHTVRLAVDIDGEFFTTYATDGLIVATPTGSTAYAFSARGPIVAPDHRALLVTPVSPHMLFDRTLVLGPEVSLGITVTGHRPAQLAVDGRTVGTLTEGDRLVCGASGHSARLVTFGPRHFHRILKAKFGLNDR